MRRRAAGRGARATARWRSAFASGSAARASRLSLALDLLEVLPEFLEDIGADRRVDPAVPRIVRVAQLREGDLGFPDLLVGEVLLRLVAETPLRLAGARRRARARELLLQLLRLLLPIVPVGDDLLALFPELGVDLLQAAYLLPRRSQFP